MPLFIKGNQISSNDITSTGAFRSKVNRDGLLIYLDAQSKDSYSGSGTSWVDLSGNGNNFTLFNSPTYTSSATNSYFTFNGSSSQMAYCNNLVPSDYVTVELAFKKIGDLGTEDIIFNKENCWEMKTDANTLQWAVYSAGNTWFWYSVTSISLNTNYFVSLTYDGNCVRTYVNGVLTQTYTGYTGVLANQNSAYPKINARNTAQTEVGGPGYIDVYNFKVYNRALNSYEIMENYQSIKTRLGL
jgi:hypothetical protein